MFSPMIMQVAWHYEQFCKRDVRAVWDNVMAQVEGDPMALRTPCAFLDALSEPQPVQLELDLDRPLRRVRAERRRPRPPALAPDPEVTQLINRLNEFECPRPSRYPVVLAAGAVSSAWPSLQSVIDEGQPRGERAAPDHEESYLQQAQQVFRAPVRRVAETSFGGQTIFAGYSIFGELTVAGGTSERVAIETRDDGLIEAHLWDERRHAAARMLIDEGLGFFRGTILDLREGSGAGLAAAFIDRLLGVESFQIGPVKT